MGTAKDEKFNTLQQQRRDPNMSGKGLDKLG